ncbi:keratin, type II cytoskeletal 2 epidermal-like [Impatiens glandulifera]|uniref:keratin, type II cytoskeletal 2 epidermal-like n=1 Tax=Impatiens glandulifera TaxID=253017 RepID=UPI001FB0D74A|nr:keratin, type II cytoskeletal 2 epidermal-like [Impatiens glandulifera]
MRSMLSSMQKTMCQSMISREDDRANFSNMFKILTELDKTLKMNTYETHVSNVQFSKFQQKKSFNHQTELFDIERHINDERHKENLDEFALVKNQLVEMQGCMRRNDNERQAFAKNLARKFQAKEDSLGNAESSQPRPVQGESSRRNDGIATGTRSRRAPSSDDNPRPTKRGDGRSGSERGGRNVGGRSRLSNVDQGGRGSVAERGGRSNAGSRGCFRRTDGERHEFADSIARKYQAKENAKADGDRDQPRITQGESSRRSDGVSTDTRSRRAPSNDENPRPTKRGGGRSGGDRGGRSSGGGRGRQSGFDQRGRASGGDHGGRSSGSGRGGRILPPFLICYPVKT